ncbi:MAG: hypothetical protein ACPG7F_13515 [Aggregatilineales bacterium]
MSEKKSKAGGNTAQDWGIIWGSANIALWFAVFFFVVELFSDTLPSPFGDALGFVIFGIILGIAQKYLIHRIFGRKLPYWILFTAVGAGIGILCAEGFYELTHEFIPDRAGILFAFIFAGSIGLAQWIILRGHVVHNAHYWIIVTILTGMTLVVALENNVIGLFFIFAQAAANWMVISWLFGEWQTDEKPESNFS